MASSRNSSTERLPSVVAACLERHAATGRELAVGLSGGLDSVVLLHSLKVNAKASRRPLPSAIHIHHGLSPNADTWELHCRALCVDWDIPLAVYRVSVERGSPDGLEAAARRARYDIFAKAPQDWIALGHHRNDQAETLLFNLLRGTGLRGAAAMAERRGRLLRPLLTMDRAEILEYAQRHGLRWIEDESNADTRFSRNHLRHAVLRDLELRFPGAMANLAGAASRFGEARELLDALALEDLGAHAPAFPLPVSALRPLAEPRARNVLRFLLQRAHIGIPSEERLREALRQLLYAAQDRHPAIRFGHVRLARRKGRIHVEPESLQED